MILGRVVGNVVSTHKDEGLADLKLLLVERVELDGTKGGQEPLVAMDSVGAGRDDVVLVVSGSSARMTAMTTGRPCDAVVAAIVDLVEVQGKITYNKSQDA